MELRQLSCLLLLLLLRRAGGDEEIKKPKETENISEKKLSVWAVVVIVTVNGSCIPEVVLFLGSAADKMPLQGIVTE